MFKSCQKRIPLRFVLTVLLAAAVLSICACSTDAGKTAKLDDLQLTIRTDPAPPKVGYDALIQATLTGKDQQPRNDCQLRFRQFMSGMEMDTDKSYISLKRTADDGEFEARSAEFSMGGNWILEFELDCQGKESRRQFVYNVPWPE